MNRAIAKRPYFEVRSDKRYFLARTASEVRAGRIEVHAFCLMTTHFHLLVRSPAGELSDSMRRIQNAYTRHFNRLRRRDGPLIRARYLSKRVDSDAYRHAVVRYIDANPVRAGLVSSAPEHEFGSAGAFVTGSSPRWLSTEWVRARALELTGHREFDAATYAGAFGQHDVADMEATAEFVEARMASARDGDPLDDLIGGTPAQVQEWMRWKAQLADGMEVGLPVSGPTAVLRAVARDLQARGDWVVDAGERAWRGSEVASAGLLRELAALPFERIGRRLDLGPAAVTRRVRLHRTLLRDDAEYAERIASVAREAMGRCGGR